MNGFKIVLIGVLLSYSLATYAQNNSISVRLPSEVPVSPDAASLIKYVDYPVDYSVGLADISIPLYEIKVGDLVLPITLSYHASGLKPRESSGWVGTGWTLNAEPSIARVVKGLPDDKPTSGYFYNAYNDNSIGNEQTYLRQMISGQWDEQPDGFYYKLLTERGSFYLNRKYEGYTHTRNPHHGFVSQPFNALIINNTTSNLSSFSIRDKSGVLYLFGGTNYLEYAKEQNDVITRLLCSSVQGATSLAKINFSYHTPTSFSHTTPATDVVVVEDQKFGFPYLTETQYGASRSYHIAADGTKEIDPYGDNFSFEQPISYNTVVEKKISEITFDNGKVTFSRTNDYKLSGITVYDKEGNVIKQINFFISKYNNSTNLTKLDSVQIRGQGLKIMSYKLEYISPGLVPSNLTNAIDHWGFYNMQSNVGLVPFGTVSSEVTGYSNPIEHEIGNGNRESNFIGALAGALKYITSPEGVLTKFSYEPHKYGFILHPKFNIPVYITGGLRIQEIDVVDAKYTAQGYTRMFEYGEIIQEEQEKINGDWGIPKHTVTANDYCYTKNQIRIGNFGGQHSTSRLRFWSSNPIKDISYNNGSSMIYGTVTEKYVSKTDGTMLITKRKYNVPDGFATKPLVADISDMPFSMDNKSDFKYGQLISEEKFKDEGTIVDGQYIYSLVSKTENIWSHHKRYLSDYTGNCELRLNEYSYPCVDGSIRFGVAYNRANVMSPIYYNPTSYEDFKHVSWSLDNGCMKMDKQTTTNYFKGQGAVTETKEYVYNDSSYHMLPVKITTTTSNDAIKEEYFSYPEDLIVNASAMTNPEDLGQTQLLALRSITNLLEHTRKKNGAVQSTRMKYNGRLPMLVKTKGDAEAYENRINYHAYDNYGNVAETSYSGGSHTCYVWSYNNQSPVAKIENATYAEVVSALGQEFIDNLRIKHNMSSTDLAQISNLRTLLNNSLVTTYTYKPLIGVTSITDPKGKIMYYDYDDWGNLKRTYTKENDSNGQTQESTRKYYEYNYYKAH